MAGNPLRRQTNSPVNIPPSTAQVDVANPSFRKYIASQLHQNGYVLLPEWHRKETTIAITRLLGTVVDVGALLPESSISTVQILKPRHKTRSSSNQYSGTYGLAEFPLHTDLAHWAQPPRYFILRCQKGTHEVTTPLLPSSVLDSILGTITLRRALARPRRSIQNGVLLLLPLVFCIDGIRGFRWDPLFLVPMNDIATRVAEIMLIKAWNKSKLTSLVLAKQGDTLIVDNWRCLHGRSSVSVTNIDRKLERVYLSEIHI